MKEKPKLLVDSDIVLPSKEIELMQILSEGSSLRPEIYDAKIIHKLFYDKSEINF